MQHITESETVMTANAIEAGNLTNVKPGWLTIADNGSGGSVWFYVVAPLPNGQAYGVNLGTNKSYVAPDGDGYRFMVTTIDAYNQSDHGGLASCSQDVRDALAAFFRDAGLTPPQPITDGQDQDDVTALVEQARAEERERLTRQFDEWKERANIVAIEYAENNDLCGEFERCMEEIGFRGRYAEYDVTVSVTLRVRARNEDDAEDQASNLLYNAEHYGYNIDGESVIDYNVESAERAE